MSTMCCRHCVHVSYSHASTSALRSSAVNVVVSVTCAIAGHACHKSAYWDHDWFIGSSMRSTVDAQERKAAG